MTVDATPYMDICEKLSAEVDQLRSRDAAHGRAIKILERHNEELRARIRELEEALRPFAEAPFDGQHEEHKIHAASLLQNSTQKSGETDG